MIRLRSFLYITACLGAGILSGCDMNTAPSQDSEPVTLKLNFKQGEKYQYITDSRLELQPEVNGMSFTINQDMKIVSSYFITSVNGADKNVAITYERITMRSGASALSKEYDSDDTTEPDELFRDVAEMVKKPFNMTINDIGQVVAYKGIESNPVSDTAISQDAIMSDSSVRKMLMQSLNVYPRKPVLPGSSWIRSFRSSVGFMDMRIINTYKMASVKDGIAHLEMTAKITTEDTANKATMQANIRGVQTGTIDMEVETGLIKEAKITQQLSGTINMIGKDNPVNAKTEIHILGTKIQ